MLRPSFPIFSWVWLIESRLLVELQTWTRLQVAWAEKKVLSRAPLEVLLVCSVAGRE